MQLEISGRDDYGTVVQQALDNEGIKKVIGISGGADSKLAGVAEDDALQEQYQQFNQAYLNRIISDFLGVFKGYPVSIQTGGTIGGVPEIASTTARKLGFHTIGVHPRRGREYALSSDTLDISITVDPLIGEAAWGDEGPVWTSLVHGLIVIGGGAGTLTECAHIQKINESNIKKGDPPKFIVPIHGSGGVADQLLHLWSKPDVRNASMPSTRVYGGHQAARVLIEKLELDQFFDPILRTARSSNR